VEWARRKDVEVELLESFVAFPENDGWADFVAVFRKAGGRPFQRRGRIVGHTRAMNVYNVGAPVGADLEQTSWQTPDMLAMAQAADLTQTLVAERDAAAKALEAERGKAAGLERQLADSQQARDIAIFRARLLETDPLFQALSSVRSAFRRVLGRSPTG